MHYRLDLLLEAALVLGFTASQSAPDAVQIDVAGGVLEFRNLHEEEDAALGFGGTPWHSHGSLVVDDGSGAWMEYDEIAVLRALAQGELAVRSAWRDDTLLDRWIAHPSQPLRDGYGSPDEEVREWRRQVDPS